MLEIRQAVLVHRKTSYENFLWIPGFQIGSMAKMKTRKCQNSTESFLNKKIPLLTVAITEKLLICYPITIYGFNNKKIQFQTSVVNSHQ